MEVYGYVYMVRNKVNGKIYFGITEDDFDTRYRGSIKNTKNKHLKNSIKKYGIENFEINKEFDVAYNENDLYDLEDMYICLYNTLDDKYGYNKRRSGSKHKGSGKHSEETRHKQSESKKYFYSTEKGMKARQKISDSKKGDKNPFYGKKRPQHSEQMLGQDNPFYGKHHTEETKRKISEAKKGKYSGENSFGAKKIICLETLQSFNTIIQARDWCGLKGTGSGICECCKGNRKSAGKHPITKQPLHWMYYTDYLKQLNKNNEDLVTSVA